MNSFYDLETSAQPHCSFALVAAGVRKLAERSQKAAGEINQLSGTTVKVSERVGEMLDKPVRPRHSGQSFPSVDETARGSYS